MLEQQDLFDTEAARSLLDQLLEDSKLYHKSADYFELLKFVGRLRNIAPFNAMLLQIQKPGLQHAASAHDWLTRFNRRPKQGARPLLILWPFGPVALVYDLQDTEGDPVPAGVNSFDANGDVTHADIDKYLRVLRLKGIHHEFFDGSDTLAGSISYFDDVPATGAYANKFAQSKKSHRYLIRINQNHLPAVQFSTLAHELGHLLLGHLGPDENLNIRQRRAPTSHKQKELEAESFAYLVCSRNGVHCRSESYLANYVEQHESIESIDLYLLLRAAGIMEQMLGLTAHTRYQSPKKRK